MKPLAWHNGQIVTTGELTISVFDLGFTLGVTVAEQLRTFGGQLFQLDQHFQRLRRSLQIVGIDDVDLQVLRTQAQAIVSHNHSLLQPGDDVGLTIFVTPGLSGSDAGQRSVGMYTTPIPFQRWADRYESGETLVVSSVRQVPGTCWPEELKCRSRMHYYLADQQAQRTIPGSRALLLDQEGFLAEASTAGVLLYRSDEGLVAPLATKVLPSISVGVIRQLAAQLPVPFVHRDIELQDVTTADEVFLTSTSPCLLPVIAIDDSKIGDGRPGPVFQQILTAWNTLVNLDIAAQARQYSQR